MISTCESEVEKSTASHMEHKNDTLNASMMYNTSATTDPSPSAPGTIGTYNNIVLVSKTNTLRTACVFP